MYLPASLSYTAQPLGRRPTLSRSVVGTLVLSFLAIAGSAQQVTSSTTLSSPTRVADYSVKSTPRFIRKNKMPSTARTSIQAEALLGSAAVTIISIPHWSSSFTTAGVKYPYTMVGTRPSSNITSTLKNALLPVRFVFNGYKDVNGNKLVISPSAVITKIKNSPNWRSAPYSTGYTQFGDAVQRAEFYKTMGANWHTLLAAPRMLPTATIVVPVGSGKVFKTSSGVIYARVDADLYETGITKVIDAADLRPGEFALAVSRNILLTYRGNCCILGFHTSFQTGGTITKPAVQTFSWASWIDQKVFANTDIADVMAISHEIVEWINDPFVDNTVPAWKYPDGSGCQDNLETGDPVEVLYNMSIPVTLSGFAYHPQTEALLQWFSREKPSSAIHGAYSYPDISALRSPSRPCF
jgi:hypothetical protein